MNNQDPTAEPGPAPEAPPVLPFPLVGVGASAGGLEAVTRLLEGLPADPGLSLLVVFHLQPHTESQLPEILDKVTPLPVQEAKHGTRLAVNHAYVIPPNTTMTIVDGAIALNP